MKNKPLSREMSKLLLEEIREANRNKLNELDIVVYEGGYGTWENYTLEDQSVEFLSIKVSILPHASSTTSMLLKPSEISKQYITIWNGLNGNFVKFTFHKRGITGPTVQISKTHLEVIVNKADEDKVENYLFKFKKFKLLAFDNTTQISGQHFSLITINASSGDAVMPQIKAKAIPFEKDIEEVEMRCLSNSKLISETTKIGFRKVNGRKFALMRSGR